MEGFIVNKNILKATFAVALLFSAIAMNAMDNNPNYAALSVPAKEVAKAVNFDVFDYKFKYSKPLVNSYYEQLHIYVYQQKYITVEQAKKAWRDYWKNIIIVRCRNSDGMSPSDFMYSYLSNPVLNPLGEDLWVEDFLKGPSSVEVAVSSAVAVLAVAALGYALHWYWYNTMSETELEVE